MKILVKADGHNINLLLPTGMLFGKGTVWLANHFGRLYAQDALKDIPPEALDALFAEFRRIKKKYGSWELVDIESASGELVKIIL